MTVLFDNVCDIPSFMYWCCRYLVRLGVIGPLCDMLLAQSPQLVTVVLECLGVILKVGKLEQD